MSDIILVLRRFEGNYHILDEIKRADFPEKKKKYKGVIFLKSSSATIAEDRAKIVKVKAGKQPPPKKSRRHKEWDFNKIPASLYESIHEAWHGEDWAYLHKVRKKFGLPKQCESCGDKDVWIKNAFGVALSQDLIPKYEA